MTERLNAEAIDRRNFENELHIYFCRKALEHKKENRKFLKTMLIVLLGCSVFWFCIAILILKFIG